MVNLKKKKPHTKVAIYFARNKQLFKLRMRLFKQCKLDFLR